MRIYWASQNLVKEAMDNFLKKGFLTVANGIYIRADQDKNDLLDSLEERIYFILDNFGMTPPAPYNLYEEFDIDRKEGNRVFKNSAPLLSRSCHLVIIIIIVLLISQI